MSEIRMVEVSMIWHDDDEGLIWHEIIAIGEDDENNPNDESIFYYVEDMAELESLRDPANGNEWHIVEIDYEGSPLPFSGVWLI